MTRSSRQGAIPSDIGDIVDELADIRRRLDTVEAPSGEALSSTVAKLEGLIGDIQAQLDAYNASRYTNAQIDAAIAAGIAAALAGNVTIGGNLTANGQIRFPNVVATVFGVEPRTVVWADTSNGRIGRT